MAVQVYVWVDNTISPGHSVSRGVCPEYPEIDVSSWDDVDQAQLRAYVLESWNRRFPDDERTLDDFDFADRPKGWVEPNN